MQQDKKTYAGPDARGNYDAADFAVGPNQWVNMENCRVGSTDFVNGGEGNVESVGNLNLLFSTGLTGVNINLGSTWDRVGNRILFFNYNSNGTHGIYCYDIIDKVTYTVLLSADVVGGLGFDRHSPIHSCFVVNGNLYWTDGTNNEPRRLNVDSGIKMYAPLYPSDSVAYVSPLNQSVIAWVRRPPGLPLTALKSTDISVETNFIATEAMQFMYRYEYYDHEVSVLSSWSILSNYNREGESNNCVLIQVPSAEIIDQDVLKVDIVVRFSDGTFFIIKTWDKNNPTDLAEIIAHNTSGTPLFYKFFNDYRGIALDKSYANKLYDSVPRYSETCEHAKNRNFLGNNISGYDTPIPSSLTATPVSGVPTDRLFKSDATYQVSITFYDNYQRSSGYNAPVAARVYIPDRIYGTFTPPTLYPSISWSLSNVAALTEIPEWAYYYSINITRCNRTRFFMQMRGVTSSYYKKNADGTLTYGISEYSSDNTGCAFDISSLESVGMGYLYSQGDLFKFYRATDDNYLFSIIGQDGPWILTELKNVGTLNATIGYLFEIYTPHKPSVEEPAFEVKQIFKVNTPGTNIRAYSTTSGSILGDVYTMERTDNNRAYFIMNPIDEPRNDDHDATIGIKPDGLLAPDPDFTLGTSIFRSVVGFDIATNNDRWWFRNNSAGNLVLRITGTIEVMPDSNRQWRLYVADNLNQQTNLVNETVQAFVTKTFTYDVTVTVGAGNRMFILHQQSINNSMFFYSIKFNVIVNTAVINYDVEAMSPNDTFYKNWNFPDTGRGTYIDKIGEVHNITDVAYSNGYIAGSKQNGLSTFEALNVKPLSIECGPLRKLESTAKVGNEIGTIMLAICEGETASLYLGEIQLVGASAASALVQTPEVIGTINILKGSFGTKNPESVVEFRGNVYWYDEPNGKYIQYSPNGLFPISNYDIRKCFHLFSERYRNLSQSEIEAFGSRPYVYSGIDPYNEEILVSIPKVLPQPPKGYLPDYPSIPYPFDIWDGRAKSLVYRLNREPNFWNGAYEIPAEGYVYANDEIYSFKFGALYIHNQPGFGIVYGTQTKSRIMLLVNTIPQRPKEARNFSVESSTAPSFVYFRTESPDIQASDLVDFDFVNKEGIFYAKQGIYRNKIQYTQSGVNYNGLLTGEYIRGAVIKIMVEFTTGLYPMQLRFINIGYNISRGHNT